MIKRKNSSNHIKIVIAVIVVTLLIGLLVFFQKEPSQEFRYVSKIDDYSYYLDNKTTRLYKKYFKKLKTELEDNKIDEENYAKLISKLFTIDFYTLNNKVTNRDIGGIQFIHSELVHSFIEKSSNTVYKYLKNNLNNKRRQQLPEVNDVEVLDIKKVIYNKKYKDNSGYEVKIKIGYVTDLDYPKEIKLTIIHEENKLVIVEIE